MKQEKGHGTDHHPPAQQGKASASFEKEAKLFIT
jgi:hypothetical protein